jgi:hypothetical protein
MLHRKSFFGQQLHSATVLPHGGPDSVPHTADAVFVLYIHDRGRSAARFSAKVVGY